MTILYDNRCTVIGCDGRVIGLGLCNKHYLRNQRGTLHGVSFREVAPENRRARPGERQEWLRNALATETDACILWPFRSRVGDGHVYGMLGDGKTAHRWICEEAHGPCPPGMESRHSCGTGLCCNKRHVSWSTHSENETDKVVHGTFRRDTVNGRFMKATS